MQSRIVRWAAALAVCAAATGCAAPTVSVTPRALWLAVDGEIGAKSEAVMGSLERTDTNDLGLAEQPAIFAPRAEVDWGPAHVFLDGLAASYEGTGNVDQTLSIGGITLNNNAEVETELDLAFARGLLTFDLVPTDVVDVGIGLGVGLYDLGAKITDVAMMQTESTEQTVPVPLAAGRLATEVGPIQLSGILSGIHVPLDELTVTLFDADVAASYEFASFTKLGGHVVVGYRHIGLEADYEDSGDEIEADLRFSGPYAGVAISF